MAPHRIPRPILAYGLAGVLPFLALPLLALVPAWQAPALAALAAYAALILSFLGGARWGLEASRPAPRLGTVTLAMAPTLAGFALLLLPVELRAVQLAALAAALAVHLAWDRGSVGLPAWYPRLRTLLTAGAFSGLLGGLALA